MKSEKFYFTLLVSITILFQSFHVIGKDNNNIQIGGFTQIKAVKKEFNKAVLFSINRARLYFKGDVNNYVYYKFQVDFIKQAIDKDKDGDTPAMIKDAMLTYHLPNSVNLTIGKFKTPIGMEFDNTPVKLDIIDRGSGQALVFERNTGMMLHQKAIGRYKLGYAIGIFNYGPNNAVDVGEPKDGNDYSLANRISIDPSDRFHLEVYSGIATTSKKDQDNITIAGFGIIAKPVKKTILKYEFMTRDDNQNSNSDGTDYYIQGQYQALSYLEPVIKYEKLNINNNDKDQTDITLGLNIFLNPKNKYQSRIQLNYVVSDLENKDLLQIMFSGVF